MPESKCTFRKDALVADTTLDHAKRWMSIKDTQDVLVRRWQDLEHALSLRIKPLGLDLEEAAHSDLSEARAMRTLMRKIEDYDLRLNQQIKCLAGHRAASLAGTLAKIEVALRMTCPGVHEEDIWALVVSAAHDLRGMAQDTPSVGG